MFEQLNIGVLAVQYFGARRQPPRCKASGGRVCPGTEQDFKKCVYFFRGCYNNNSIMALMLYSKYFCMQWPQAAEVYPRAERQELYRN